MTNYTRGRAYEYRIKKQLEEEGWPLVIRSAGSHSEFDLIAIRPPFVEKKGQIELIQCKSGKSAKRAIKKVKRGDIKRFEGLYSVSVEIL